MSNEQMLRDALERLYKACPMHDETCSYYVGSKCDCFRGSAMAQAQDALAATRDDVTLPRLDGKA